MIGDFDLGECSFTRDQLNEQKDPDILRFCYSAPDGHGFVLVRAERRLHGWKIGLRVFVNEMLFHNTQPSSEDIEFWEAMRSRAFNELGTAIDEERHRVARALGLRK